MSKSPTPADHLPSTETGRAAPVYTDDPMSNAMMDFLDERADAWMQETHIIAATHGMCAVLAKGLPRPVLEKFRKGLEAHFHLCFVEGGLRAWEEISAQQRSLGQPLPSVGASTPKLTDDAAVERGARAMWIEIGGDPDLWDETGRGSGREWVAHMEGEKEAYRARTRAALTAALAAPKETTNVD